MPYSATDAQRVRTLDELDNWSFDGTALAVLGDPIAHSLSPVMHNAALHAMAQTQHTFANWRYFKFHVPPEQLPAALKRLHAAGFHGINLTVPHKIQAIEILGKGAVSDFAATAGAANTLIRTDAKNAHVIVTAEDSTDAIATDNAGTTTNANASASWHGDNTDGYGLEQALAHELGASLGGADVLLLGAGGAARAAAVHCLRRGVRNLWIANRTTDRLEALVQSLQPLAGSGQCVRGFTPGQPPVSLPLSEVLIINATAIGLKADDPTPINLKPFDPRSTLVYDMTYGVENGFARAARNRSIPFADGLSMLVWQGVRALEIWSGTSVPAHVMQQALLNHLAARGR